MALGSSSSFFFGSSGAGGSSPGYQIEKSVRLNSSDTAHLSRTTVSTGNRKTWTWAAWVKISKPTSGYGTLFSGAPAQNYSIITYKDDGRLALQLYSPTEDVFTVGVLRDFSAWYHIVLSFDSTQATSANRVRFYVNGNLQDTTGSVTQNRDTFINLAGQQNMIGRFGYSGFNQPFDGYLAEIHFIDGQALDPTSFGEFDANGVWQPINVSGLTYGTNGFYLPLTDNSTAAALGTDASGNNNTFTVNNISVTAGVGNDSLIDTPTNGSQTDTGVGGEVVGNYATLNAIDNGGLTLSNGNLDCSRTVSSWVSCRATIGMSSGKWYWEFSGTGTYNTSQGPLIGVTKNNALIGINGYPGADANGWGYFSGNGLKYTGGVSASYGATWTGTDVIGVAFDADNGTLTFYKNNVSQGTAFTGLTSGPYFPTIGLYGTATSYVNFGQRPWVYQAPAGFKALCTTNLPEPTIAKPSEVMDVALYTGNGSTQTISGLNLSPDLVWIKNRTDASTNPSLWDAIRGAGTSVSASKRLSTDSANPERTSGDQYGYLSALNSDGFTVVKGTALPDNVNDTSKAYVAWCWDAGSSTVTNTQGSITSQVRANPSAGFSIVTWTGDGSASATVGHGLGIAPVFYVSKDRTAAGNWQVLTTAINGSMQYGFLNLTNAFAAAGQTAPTSTVLNLLSGGNETTNGRNYVAYCFAPVAGYSSAFTYTGNGSNSGPFVYLGFRPRFFFVKRTDSTGDWWMYDAARNPYNVTNYALRANSSAAEVSDVGLDMLSNGFRYVNDIGAPNTSGASYVGFAFAESPFQYARAR